MSFRFVALWRFFVPMSDIEQYKEAFIRKQLRKHGYYLVKILSEDIRERDLISNKQNYGRNPDKHRISNKHLIDRINFEFKASGESGSLRFIFPAYGRLIEIKFHKARKNKTLVSRPNTDELLYGIRPKSPINKKETRRRKDTRWYARNVYGSLNTLIGNLMWGFTNMEAEYWKSVFEETNKQMKSS